MARARMVTRTITSTIATVMGVDVETSEVSNKTFVLSSTYKDKKALTKAVKNVGETDTYKIVDVVDVQVEEKLYGMSEQKFIENAEVLPNRTSDSESEINE